jgi:Sugar kinases, ribokinase family
MSVIRCNTPFCREPDTNSFTLGVLGEDVIDEILENAKITNPGPPVAVEIGGMLIEIEAHGRAFPGAKVIVKEWPESNKFAGGKRQFGGGGYNSARAAGSLFPCLQVNYLDSGSNPGAVDLPENVRSAGLNRRQTRVNRVFGNRDDKVILKSPIGSTSALVDDQTALIRLLARNIDGLLINSAKDADAVETLLAESITLGVPTAVVLTPSLSWEFYVQSVLPQATLVIASRDEVSAATGITADKSLAGIADVAATLAGIAPNALVLVTMGSRGAIGLRKGGAPFHVSLGTKHARGVRSLVAENPARVNGAGDAFAAGAAVAWFSGQTLAITPHDPISTTIAGNATALRWLGYPAPLSADDFIVNLLPA